MTEHSLSVTLKAGTGYDSPWVVIYGNDPSEVEFKLDNITGVLQKATSAAAAFRTLQTLESGGVQVAAAQTQAAPPQQWQDSAPAAQPAWSQPQQQAAPAQSGARFHPEGKTCRCGNVLNFKQVNRKSDGKQFQFWECPARTGSKDVSHDSEFAN